MVCWRELKRLTVCDCQPRKLISPKNPTKEICWVFSICLTLILASVFHLTFQGGGLQPRPEPFYLTGRAPSLVSRQSMFTDFHTKMKRCHKPITVCVWQSYSLPLHSYWYVSLLCGLRSYSVSTTVVARLWQLDGTVDTGTYTSLRVVPISPEGYYNMGPISQYLFFIHRLLSFQSVWPEPG